MQQGAGKIRVFLVLLIKTKHERLNHEVTESVGSCGKHIGDRGVHVFIITRVGGQMTGYAVWTNNVK